MGVWEYDGGVTMMWLLSWRMGPEEEAVKGIR